MSATATMERVQQPTSPQLSSQSSKRGYQSTVMQVGNFTFQDVVFPQQALVPFTMVEKTVTDAAAALADWESAAAELREAVTGTFVTLAERFERSKKISGEAS